MSGLHLAHNRASGCAASGGWSLALRSQRHVSSRPSGRPGPRASWLARRPSASPSTSSGRTAIFYPLALSLSKGLSLPEAILESKGRSASRCRIRATDERLSSAEDDADRAAALDHLPGRHQPATRLIHPEGDDRVAVLVGRVEEATRR